MMIIAIAISLTVVIGCIAITLISINISIGQYSSPTPLAGYISTLFRFCFHQVPSSQFLAAASVAQPLLLACSLLILVHPAIKMGLEAVSRHDEPIVVNRSSSKQRNRRINATELTKQFQHADDICMISGDYSWFKGDGEEGQAALQALVDKMSSDSAHVSVITYKNRNSVALQLSNFEEKIVNVFLKNLKEMPHLNGLKMTIISNQSFKTLHMICPTSDGRSEQRITIKSLDYGRKIIDSFHQLCAS
ncbi:hypothetical protein [Novosphingobium naphthalenivorans]|uniref:hypothetical protein n=1 Tax=Novosphingobium naphthalenivorans TaxID=273168 RepID=UPI0012ECE7E3|nr:hypothetical protein [Novosphingobium naphthalenivorans]